MFKNIQKYFRTLAGNALFMYNKDSCNTARSICVNKARIPGIGQKLCEDGRSNGWKLSVPILEKRNSLAYKSVIVIAQNLCLNEKRSLGKLFWYS